MPDPTRRPLAKMESRDERLTVRLTPTELEAFRDHARAVGEETSRYLRRCAVMGDTMRQHLPGVQPTGG